MTPPPAIPRATARLQFHRGFTLHDAVTIVPYLHRLGISHLYASPLMTACPGSTHGYDVIDPNRVNPELGGEPALRRLVAALRAHGMGLILDIVPNHTAVGGIANPWWQDVLEWGHASPYAKYFDIDWTPRTPSLRGRVLAPFLGRPYGACLDSGEIALRFDPAEGRLYACYYDHRFPIAPRTYPAVLAELARPLAALSGKREEARAQAETVRQSLLDPTLTRSITAALAAFDPGTPKGRGRLHDLLERQCYRLAWWRAAEEINWRRFFDINGLAGMRVERPDVFAATHEGVLRLYAEGLIDAIRVDHVDGLADPRGYCRRLRRHLAAAAASRPSDAPLGLAPIWVEKILADGEDLPTNWRTDGTTGYDFMDQVAAVLHDPDGASALTTNWVETTGRPSDFAEEVDAARRQILRENLASETAGCVAGLCAIADEDPATRDYGPAAMGRVLEALLARFPVYRIYAGSNGASPADTAVMGRAAAVACSSLRFSDRTLLDLLATWLRGDGLRDLPAAPRQRRRRAMRRFQQLSAPAVAKSVEDTAFYRYGRLLSRNEVGSDPGVLARSPETFHASMQARLRHFPHALLATATHDQKRGEDARARLAVLSEVPDLWAATLTEWLRRTEAWRTQTRQGSAPDAADAAILFQSLLGAWPPDLRADDEAGLTLFADRMAAWQQKALREAKRRSDWFLPDADYESACRAYLERVLDPARSAGLTEALGSFAARIAPAGALNSLAQTTLRLTVPGVPDLYQGTEFWDFSLVDPDNRRQVDFATRSAALTEAMPPAALLPNWRNGRVKQALIARLLGLRASLPALFSAGAYVPLRLSGKHAGHALAFARVHDQDAMVAVVTRLAAPLPGVATKPHVDLTFWEDTTLHLPRCVAGRVMTDVLSEQRHQTTGNTLPLAQLLRALPVAVLEAG